MGRLMAFLFTALSLCAAESGALQISGRIPCMGYLASGGADNGVELEGAGSAVRVRAPAGTASFALVLRTNCSYRIAVSSSTATEITRVAVTAAAGVGRLAPTALDPVITPVDVSPGSPGVCVRGHRVSSGGNNLTTDNAILIRIELASSGPENTAATFSLELAP